MGLSQPVQAQGILAQHLVRHLEREDARGTGVILRYDAMYQAMGDDLCEASGFEDL